MPDRKTRLLLNNNNNNKMTNSKTVKTADRSPRSKTFANWPNLRTRLLSMSSHPERDRLCRCRRRSICLM